jgi:hypothetical protein
MSKQTGNVSALRSSFYNVRLFISSAYKLVGLIATMTMVTRAGTHWLIFLASGHL